MNNPKMIKTKKIRKPLIMALEPRVLLDGAALATGAEMLTDLDYKNKIIQDQTSQIAPTMPDAAIAPTQIRTADPTQNNSKKEVAFVDSSVQDYQILIEGIGAGIEIQLIDGVKDGLAQINTWAQTHTDYDAIHILSHGSSGDIHLGTTSLTSANLSQHTTELTNIGNSLTADGDILVYGCDVASGQTGMDFIGKLAQATDADIAASDDATGSTSKNGDWVLEAKKNSIEVNPLMVTGYVRLLDTTAPTIDVLHSSPVDNNLGVGEYRNIIVDFNENIAFGASGVITLKDITNGTTVETFDTSTASGGVVAGSLGSTATIANDKLTINPKTNLKQGTQYSVVFAGGSIKDTAGNALASIDDTSVYNFTTQGATPAYQGKTTSETKSVAAFAAIREDGTVVTWGSAALGGSSSGLGLDLTNVVQVFSGMFAFAALKADGTVVTWGEAYSGGDSSKVKTELTNVVQVFSTDSAFAALKADGSVVTWGNSDLGANSSGKDLTNVVQVFSSQNAFAALKADGSVVTWGRGGGGDSTGKDLTNVVQVFSTSGAFAALKADGSVVSWGNADGGNSTDKNLTNVVQVFSNMYSFAALKADGSVITWGADYYGGDSSGKDLTNVVQVFSTGSAFAALKADGSVVTWGNSVFGANSSGKDLTNVVHIFSTAAAFAALKADGSVVTWGYATHGGDSSSVTAQLNDPTNKVVAINDIYSNYNVQLGPKVKITAPKTSLNLADASTTVSFTLSDEVTGFTASDITVTGGTLSNFAGSGQNYTATFTPQADFKGSAVISIAQNSFTATADAKPNLADATLKLAVDTTPPSFDKASIANGKLVLTFTQPLDATNLPLASAFTVTSGSQSIAVTNVAVSGQTVTLTLATPTSQLDGLTVSYTDPTTSNDVSAIQDTLGRDAGDTAKQSFSNSKPTITSASASPLPTFTEQQTTAVSIGAIGSITDTDDTLLSGAKVSISTGFTTGDVLTWTNATEITGSYDANTGILTFTGNATPDTYKSLLSSVKFNNASDTPTVNGTKRVFSISVTDAGGGLMPTTSDSAVLALNVVGVNDSAPTLDPSKSPEMTGLLNVIAPANGSLPSKGLTNIADLVAYTGISNVTDTDKEIPGISITSVTNEGTFYYTINSGAIWKPITASSLSPTSPLLLRADGNTFLYYVPKTGAVASSIDNAITFRAWDGTKGANGSTLSITPSLTESLNTSGTTRTLDTTSADEVFIQGNLAYISDNGGGLKVFDITDPTAVKPLSAKTLSGTTNYSLVQDGKLYVLESNKLKVYTSSGVTNTADTSLASVEIKGGTAHAVAVSGNYAYIADDSVGLKVVNLTTKAVEAGYWDTQGTAWDVKITEQDGKKYAVIADGAKGLVVVDVTTQPTGKVALGSTATATASAPLALGDTAYRVVVEGNYAYVATDGKGLNIVDISTPLAPKLVATYTTPKATWDVKVNNGIAYLASSSAGLILVDVSDPAKPTLLTSLATGTPTFNASGVAIQGDYAYIADSTNGLRVVKIGDLGPSTNGVGSISDQYDTVKLNIKANTAPELADKILTLPTVNTQTGAPKDGDTTGSISIYELLGGNSTNKLTPNFSDADGDKAGIAITGVKNGTLYYSLNNGGTWVKMSGLSTTTAQVFMVDDQTRFYFDPDTTAGTFSDAVTFKAWDGSGGFSNAKTGVDTTTSTTNSFGSWNESVGVVIDPFNTAPSFDVGAGNTLTKSSNSATSLSYNGSTPVVLAPNAEIYDAQLSSIYDYAGTDLSGSFSGTTLTLQRADGANANDVFVAMGTTKLFENGKIYGASRAGATGRYEIGTYAQLAGKITFNFHVPDGSYVPSKEVKELMRSIGYTNTGSKSETVNIAWTFNDGNTGSQGVGGAKEGTGLSLPITVTPPPENNAPVFNGTDWGNGNISLEIPANLVDTSKNVFFIVPEYSLFGMGDVNSVLGSDGKSKVQFNFVSPLGVMSGISDFQAVYNETYNPTVGNDVPLVVLANVPTADISQPLTSDTDLSSSFYIGGYTDVNGNKDFEIMKLVIPASNNYQLNLDTSFANGGTLVLPISNRDDEVTSITQLSNGKLLVAGTTITSVGDKDIVLVELNADGSLNSSFGDQGKLTLALSADEDVVNHIREDASGNLILIGTSLDANGKNAATVMRLSANGVIDTTFGTNGKTQISLGEGTFGVDLSLFDWNYDVILRTKLTAPEKEMIVSGTKVLSDGSTDAFVAVLNANGQLDTRFAGGIVEISQPGDQYAGVVGRSIWGDLGSGKDYYNSFFSLTTTSNDANGQLVITNIGLRASGNPSHPLLYWAITPTQQLPFTSSQLSDQANLFNISDFNLNLSVGAGDGVKVIMDAQGNIISGIWTDYQIGNAPVVLDSALTVSDAELKTSFSGATLTLEREGGANADDNFGFAVSMTTNSYFSIISDKVYYKDSFNSSFFSIGNISSSNGKMEITLNADSTQTIINELLQSLNYKNTSTTLTTEETININITINDGNTGAQGSGGSKSDTHTVAVKVSPAVAPNDVTSTLTAGTVASPVTLATTTATLADAVNVLDFKIADIASATDSVSTKVTQLGVGVSGTGDASQVSWVLKGSDLPSDGVTGVYDATAKRIRFTSLPIDVASNSNETYTLSAYYNTTASVKDGQTFTLSLDPDDTYTADGTGVKAVVADKSGSGLVLNQATISNTVTVGVTATKLKIDTKVKTTITSGQALSQVTVSAVDALGNVDKDFTGAISLSEASAGALSNLEGLTLNAVNGVASFSVLKYKATQDQETFALSASASGLTSASTGNITADVKATKLVFAEQVTTSSIASGVDASLTGRWVVQAVDADGKVDTDFTGYTDINFIDPTDTVMDGSVDSFTADGITDYMGGYYKSFTQGALVLDSAKLTFTNGLPDFASDSHSTNKLNIQFGDHGQIAIDFSPSEIIENVKAIIQTRTGIDAANLTLFNGTTQLADERTLSDYNIQIGGQVDVHVNYSTANIALKVSSGTLPELVSNAILVEKTNTAPTITLANASVAWTEANSTVGYAGVAIAPNVVLADNEQSQLASMTVKLVNSQAGDVLYIDRNPISNFSLDDLGTNEIKVSGNWSIADYQSLLRDFKFYNDSDMPETTARQIDITLDDGQSANNTRTQSLTVTVTPTNDLATVEGSLSLSVNEDTKTPLNFSTLSLKDPDIGRDNLTVKVGVASGKLYADSGAGVTVTGSDSTLLTLTGSLNQLNKYLQASPSLIAYQGNANASGNVVLTVSVADQANDPQYVLLQANNPDAGHDLPLTINSVNDAPKLSGVPTTVTNLFVGAATALDNFTVADVDSTNLTVTLTATNGTIGGVTDADVNTSGTQVTGTVDTINAALASATFNATQGGDASIAISVTDTHETATANYAFKATMPNTPSSLSTWANQSVTTGVKASLSGIQVTDPDVSDKLTLTLTPTNAVITDVLDKDSHTAGIQITGSVADINAQLANAKILVSANGNASVAVSVTDNVVGTTPDTETYNFTATNAIPTLTAITTLTEGTEDSAYSISFAGLSGVADEADSNGSVDAFVVKAVSTGSLTIDGNAWATGTNDVISAGKSVIWTPVGNANGELNAFTVVAKDNLGAESATAVQVKVNVAAVNDAPTLSGNSYSFTGINEKGTTTGVKVATILGTMTVSDTETATADMGIAITSSPTTRGQWEVSTDSTNGSDGTWSNIGTTSTTVAKLLTKDTYIRFKAEGELSNNETVSFGYVAWDGGVGSAGGTADTTASTAFSSATKTASVALTAVDDPFSLTLSSGKATASYAENAQYVLDGELVLADPDNATNLAGSSVSINAGFNSAQDSLKINGATSGTFTSSTSQAITYAYNSSTGVMTLSGTATQASYQEALRAVQYVNSSDNPDTTARSIEVTAGTMLAWRDSSNVVHFYEYIKADGTGGTTRLDWADAKTAAAAKNFAGYQGYLVTVTSQGESDFLKTKLPGSSWMGGTDSTANWTGANGQSFSTSEDNWYWVTGPEAGTKFWTGNSGGSAPAGVFANWYSADPNNGGLFGNEDYASIMPGGNATWNDLNIPNYGTFLGVNYDINGYLVEYTSTVGADITFSKTITLTPVAQNDAPVMTSVTPTLTTVSEDVTTNNGSLISSLLASTVSDADTSASEGIAITSLTNNDLGVWEYKTASGTWTSVGDVSEKQALVLKDTASIRFKPDGNNGGTASFTYTAWDQTTGTEGNKVDASSVGGITAFSTQANTASISVTAVNDAPVFESNTQMKLSSISEDLALADNAGQTVASLLGTQLTDVDLNGSQGIAITGLTSVGTGKWQYSTNNGSTWTDLTTASESSARLLRAEDKLRFVADALNGGTASLTVRGWDRTSGSAGNTANISASGGTTAYSATTASVSLEVQAINDAPVLAMASTALAYTENAVGIALDSGLTLVDDSATLTKAKIAITQGFSSGDMLNFTTNNGVTGEYDSNTGVLTLSSDTATPTQWQAALRSVTFSSTSDDPTLNSASRALAMSIGDVEGEKSNAVSRSLNITAVNDAPVVSNNSSFSYTEDDEARVVDANLSLTDSDDRQLASATITLSPSSTGFDATKEGLGLAKASLMLMNGNNWTASNINDTGISASYTATTGILSLTGSASVLDYQDIMRSITYTNAQDYPIAGSLTGKDSRSVTWTVADANSDGSGAATSAVKTTAITLKDANEAPKVSGANNHVVSYTENGSAQILAINLTAQDDDTDGNITGATVKIAQGFTLGDQLAFSNQSNISGSYDSNTGVLTLSGNASVANYQTAMRSITFSSSSDDPTSTSATRSVIWQVLDSTNTPSAVTADTTTTVNITAVNDQATVSLLPSATLAFTEGDANVRLAAELLLSDADNNKFSNATVSLGAGFDSAKETLVLEGITAGTGSTIAGNDWTASNVKGTGIDASFNKATGVLTLSGTKDVKAYEQIMRLVSYSNTSEDPTASVNSRAIAWRVTDADSLASTQVNTTVNLTALNDAPALTGLSGTALAFIEGTPITLGSTISLSDADDTQMASAKVWISQGFTAGDSLTLNAGSLTTSYDTQTGVLTLSGTGSLADYQSALRSIQFSSGDDPTSVSTTRQISWLVTDANSDGVGAASSDLAVVKLNVTAVNDVAVITNGSASFTFTEGDEAKVIDATLTLSDADDSQLTGATVSISTVLTTGDALSFTAQHGITGNYNSGTGVLTLSGTASVAQYQEILRSVTFANTSGEPNNNGTTPSRTVTWAVTDANSDGVGAQTATQTRNLSVNAVNASPIMTAGSSLSYVEKANASVIDNTITLTDADDTQMSGATVTISAGLTDGDALGFSTQNGISGSYANGVLTLSGTASKADYQTALRSVTFSSTSEDPTAISASRTISWAVTDANSDLAGAQTSTTVTSEIVISASADAPVVTGNSSSGLSYTEGNDPVAVAPALQLTDTDDAQLSQASVRITSGLLASDKLQAETTGTAITASYNSETGVLLLTGVDTKEHYESVLRSVTFSNTSADPTASGSSNQRTISWLVSDANSDDVGVHVSNAVTSTMSVVGVNAKSVIANQSTTLAYTENDPQTLLNTAITLEDVDSTQLTGATVSITEGLTSGDTLAFTNQNGISGSYANGVLTLTGTATLAQYQSALRSITFTTTNDDPTTNSTTRTVSWQVVDKDAGGSNNVTSESKTSQITITPLNDVPTLTSMTGTIDTTNEDTAVEISLSDLLAQGNEADSDGNVSAFIVKSVATGQLTIGTSSTTATAWNSSINNVIDATNKAYWTPALNANGTLNAFTVIAKDNLGTLSETDPVQVQVAVTPVADSAVVTHVKLPMNGLYGIGNAMDFVVSFDRSVTVDTTNGTPSMSFVIGNQTVNANYLSGSGSDKLTFSYSVLSGQEDSDGISVANSSITLNDGTITNVDDSQTVNANLALGSLSSGANILVDGVAPTVSSISPTGASNDSSVTYTITLNNAVTGVDKNDFILDRTGTAKGLISAVTGAGNSYTVTVDSISGTGSLGLDLRSSGTGIIDIANNAIASGFTGATHAVDRDAPELTIDQIGDDGYVNAIESSSDIVISGTTTGVENGQQVTLSLGSINKQATVTDNGWTVSLTATEINDLSEGTLTVTADVLDVAGNSATQATSSVTYDKTAPVVAISNVTTDNHVNASEANAGITINGTAIAEDGQEVFITIGEVSKVATLSAGKWSVSMNAQEVAELTEDGEISMTAILLDKANNFGKTTGTFALDRTSPTLVINTIAGEDMINAIESSSDIVISGTTTGVENGQQVTLSLGSISKQATVTDNGWTVSLTATEVNGLSEGALTVTADVLDVAGNSATQATSNVTYDHTAPETSIDAVAGDDKINAVEYEDGFYLTGAAVGGSIARVTIANLDSIPVVVSDNVWKVWISKDSLPAQTTTSFDIHVSVTDAAGNQSSSSRSITMDTIRPDSLTIALDTDTGDSAVDAITQLSLLNIAGKESGAEIQYSYDAGISWTNHYQPQEGSNTLIIRQIDAMGNASVATEVFVFIQDSYKPKVLSESASTLDENGDSNTVVYRVTANDANTATYHVKQDIDDGYLFNIDEETGEVTLKQSADYESNQKLYRFVIVATDKAGNTAEKPVQLLVMNKIYVNDALKHSDDITFSAEFTKDMSEFFTDVDKSDIQGFEIEGLPLGLSYDAQTGIISGQVTDIGSFNIAITLVDTTGQKITTYFTLNINAPVLPNNITPITPVTSQIIVDPVVTLVATPVVTSTTTISLNNIVNGLGNLPPGVISTAGSGGASALGTTGFMSSNTTLSAPSGGGATGSAGGFGGEASGGLGASNFFVPTITSASASSVSVNVATNGSVSFTREAQPSFQTVGLAVSSIQRSDGSVQVSIVDAKPAQSYSGALADGKSLPSWVKVDPSTGAISATPPAGQRSVIIKINALGQDGVVRVLQVEVKLDKGQDKPQGAGPQALADDYLTFDQQVEIAYNEHFTSHYGDRLIQALMG